MRNMHLLLALLFCLSCEKVEVPQPVFDPGLPEFIIYEEVIEAMPDELGLIMVENQMVTAQTEIEAYNLDTGDSIEILQATDGYFWIQASEQILFMYTLSELPHSN